MADIVWVKDGKAYRSACGRFSIRNTSRTTRAAWTLFDNARRDACCPQYAWSSSAGTLATARRKAARILDGRAV